MKSSVARIYVIFAVSLMPTFALAQQAISTFHSIGLYWSPTGGSSSVTATAQYRVQGTSLWRDALPLWFDGRNSEYRGSLVNLTPGTTYEIQLSLQGTSTSTTLTVSTWSETFPISKSVYLPNGTSGQTYVITQGGTSSGYVLYTFPPGGSTTIDVANGANNCITVNASYVIIRGLTLMGAGSNAIQLANGAHDVVIEGNDISGWGRIAPDGFGKDLDAAVNQENDGTQAWRIIVQRNKMHHPRSNANDWTQYRTYYRGYHPAGPQAIVLWNSPGNNVFRYNEVYSDSSHRFNDGIGGGDNFGTVGFPGPDSDVYGNSVSDDNDDALEMEGGGRNVRVWGNYLDRTFVGIATTTVSVGPLYAFRNVVATTRKADTSTEAGVFAKLGDEGSYGSGRQYWIHNTVLQPDPTRGTGEGLSTYGGPYTNAVSFNNIFHVHGSVSITSGNTSTTNKFDYDLHNGLIRAYAGAEPHGISGVPIYALGNGPSFLGMYQLDPSSPGYDRGVLLPGFNDNYTGARPDMGAHEAGTPPMEFGVNAYLKSPNRLLH
jgi:hypothetical protein